MDDSSGHDPLDKLVIDDGYLTYFTGDAEYDALVKLLTVVLRRDDSAEILNAAAGPLIEQFAADYIAARVAQDDTP